MIFALSYGELKWSLDFGPLAVLLTVKDCVQEMAISSQEVLLPDKNLLFSQRQQFLDNHLARLPVTPKQKGTFEMREEVLASAGAQDMDTSGYEVSDLEDVEFLWANPQVEFDVFLD